MSKFNFIEVNKDLLPKTKGRRIDGHRFYEIEGKNYPSITTVLNIRKKEGLTKWRENVVKVLLIGKWQGQPDEANLHTL